MRPVIRGMCSFEALKDGRIDLADLALMNDAIDAETENQRLAEERARANRERT